MNRLGGHILRFRSSGNLSLVEVDVGGDVFHALVMETPATCSYLRENAAVDLIFQEAAVVVGVVGTMGVLNRFRGTVQRIQWGTLLTRITLDYRGWAVHAVVPTEAVRRLGLTEGKEVEWFVKATEVAIMERSPWSGHPSG